MEKIYKQFYVSPDGNDENTGSKENPFASLGRAKEAAKICSADMDGDIVINILPGYYKLERPEVFDESHSGKNGYNIIYKGTDAKNPSIFSGGTKIEGWQPTENGLIWKAPAPIEETRTLYINTLPAHRAKSKFLYTILENYVADPENTDETASDGFKVSKENFFADFKRPEDMELVWPINWIHSRTPVEDVFPDPDDPEKIIFKMKQPEWNYARYNANPACRPMTVTKTSAARHFFVENDLALLDEPGEFYFDKAEKYIYYYPYPEEDLRTAETYVGTTDMMVKICGKGTDSKVSNLVFENLDFRYGSWNAITKTGFAQGQADNIYVLGDNSDVKDTWDPNYNPKAVNPYPAQNVLMPAQVDINYAKNIQILDCKFIDLGACAISMTEGVQDTVIKGNIIRDVAGTGIRIDKGGHVMGMTGGGERCQNIEISNNVIHRVANEFMGMIGVMVYLPANTVVRNNDIKDVPYTGISLGWGWGALTCTDAWGIKALNNKIENVTSVNHDGAHIYTLDILRDGEISGNYCKKAGDWRGGIYLDEGTKEVKVIDNVIESSEQWIFARGTVGIKDVVVRGNFFDQESTSTFDPVNVIDYDNTAVYTDDDGNFMWPERALELIAAAGLEDEYKHLLDDAQYPAWRKTTLESHPMNEFASEKSTWILSIDFIKGAGEASAYHTMNGQAPIPAYGKLLNEASPGDWCKYDFYIPKTLEYTFQMRVAEREAKTEIPAKVNLYIDDCLVLKEAEIPNNGYWYDYGSKYVDYPVEDLGTVKVEKGAHTAKIEFVDNTPSFHEWRLYNEHMFDDALYDEGILR